MATPRNTIDIGRPLVHLHIPKSAGSTFNAILRRQFKPEEVYEYPSYFNTGGIDENALTAAAASAKVILGHMDARCRRHTPPGAHYVSFLRDPVERVVSGYFNIQRDSSNPAHEQVRAMSIREYIESGLVLDADNGQVRRLYGGGIGLPYGSVRESHLQNAIDNLNKPNWFVGITELFDQSLVLLGQRISGLSLHYLSENVGNWQRAIEPQTREAIRKLNAFDYELYQYQRNQFRQACLELPNFDQQLDLFRRQQRRYQIKAWPARLLRKARNRLAGKRKPG